MIGGEVEIVHLKITSDPDVLKSALESPSTQTSVINLSWDRVAEYLKWWDSDAHKHFSWAASMKGPWVSYPYENAFIKTRLVSKLIV